MYEKWKMRGFTLLELLTVLAITTMLIGLLVPSLTMVRTFAKNTKQKAQLASIGAALDTFRNDYGEYPPSNAPPGGYCGAQKLCEALLGRDLMGFDPKTGWIPTDGAYGTNDRKSRYLELATATAFKLGELFANASPLEPGTFVLCDVFEKTYRTKVKAGVPILYYRANVSSKVFTSIYNSDDNLALITVKYSDDGVMGQNRLRNRDFFYTYIRDPKIPKVPTPWPVRPDSYLLITAGADGFYGTKDDICNFTPNFE